MTESKTTELLHCIDRELSISEQYRLVTIAHETVHPGVRECALKVLQYAINPPMIYMGESHVG